MANTGRKIILTLKEVTDPGGVPTGNTKPNVPEDPDYIPPEFPSDDCPVTADTACAIVIYTGKVGSVEYEFSLPHTVVANVNVVDVRIKLMSGVTQIDADTYVNVSTMENYFHGTMTASAGTYDIVLQYINGASAVIQTCAIGSVTIT